MSYFDVEQRRTPDMLSAPLPAAGSGPGGAGSSYPRAAVPVAPVLSLASLIGGRGAAGRAATATTRARPPGILDAGALRLVTSGRVAIALALREMAIGAGASVLMPAYHCASMVEPIIWCGATPVFYRIRADTSVDLDDIAAKITPATRLLVAANYFGFPQDLVRLRAFCDEHGLLLLEDCAHSLLGSCGGRPLGSYGDYAIASSMKFFPMYEGGCLVSARHGLDGVQLHSAGAGFEIKVLLNTLEEAFAYGRLPLLKALCSLPLRAKNLLWGGLKAVRGGRQQSMSPGSSDGGFGFDPAWLAIRSSWSARWLLKRVSRGRMGQLRRSNYQRLADALDGLPGCRPLFAGLPEGVYPWVFPLLLEHPESAFHALKLAAVPVIRFGEFLWAGVDASVCPVSVDLSRRVLQFPCHQELREDELDWMIRQIRAVLSVADHVAAPSQPATPTSPAAPALPALPAAPLPAAPAAAATR